MSKAHRCFSRTKSRFRKLLADPDPGIRAVAAWALGRTGDFDVAPDLIVALEDPEDRVVTQALDGLRLLSRKIDGYGPKPGASADEKRTAARQLAVLVRVDSTAGVRRPGRSTLTLTSVELADRHPP